MSDEDGHRECRVARDPPQHQAKNRRYEQQGQKGVQEATVVEVAFEVLAYTAKSITERAPRVAGIWENGSYSYTQHRRGSKPTALREDKVGCYVQLHLGHCSHTPAVSGDSLSCLWGLRAVGLLRMRSKSSSV